MKQGRERDREFAKRAYRSLTLTVEVVFAPSGMLKSMKLGSKFLNLSIRSEKERSEY